MKTRCFIFCHGFGFDKNFWCNLAPYFSAEHCTYLDLGYFKDEYITIPEDKNLEFIGIGHSLGMIKLLSLGIKFKHMIGLNAFTNFLGNGNNLNDKRKLELRIFIQYFINSPIDTLNSFYTRCQIQKKLRKHTDISQKKLLRDLCLLLKKFNFSKELSVYIIGSKNDIVAPLEVLYDNFLSYPNIVVDLVQNNTHALGYEIPDLIYKKIILYLDTQ
jgi:pimeloyl-[acyl-carrier protein] methyl ester esterase